jgi:hypothetical protein
LPAIDVKQNEKIIKNEVIVKGDTSPSLLSYQSSL